MHSELERLKRDHAWHVDRVLIYDPDRQILRSVSAANKETSYGDEQWSNLDQLLENGWWTSVRNLIIERALREAAVPSALWDVGGGTGVVTRHLKSAGFNPIGVEPSPFAAELASQRGVTTVSADLLELELPTNSIHAVSMFDVLEHLDSRENVLQEISRILQPGGHLILTVPALMVLWSQHDVNLGHQIRYTRRSLYRELTSHGFVVERIGYFFCLTVFPLLLLRSIPYRLRFRGVIGGTSTLAASGGVLGRFAEMIERAAALRAPLGSSLLAIARKPLTS